MPDNNLQIQNKRGNNFQYSNSTVLNQKQNTSSYEKGLKIVKYMG